MLLLVAATTPLTAGTAEALPPCTFDWCPQCLPDAFPVDSRRNLSIWGIDNVLYSAHFRIGQSTNGDWFSQAIMSQVLGILSEEKLAINVDYITCQDPVSCTYAAANCAGWRTHTCTGLLSAELVQAAIAQGTKVFPDALADVMFTPETYDMYLADKYFETSGFTAETRPTSPTGPTGFTSVVGVYTYPDVVQDILLRTGVDVHWWDNFRSSEARAFLATPQQILDTGRGLGLPGCSSHEPAANRSMTVHLESGWTCRGSWWLNPACVQLGANWSQRCMAVFDDEWTHEKSRLYQALATTPVPVAKLMLGHHNWWDLIYTRLFNVTFVWWEPDATFRNHHPLRLLLRRELEPTPRIAIKLAWDRVHLEKRLAAVLNKANVAYEAIDELMLAMANAIASQGHPTQASAPAFYQKVACDWVRKTTHVWSTWINTLHTCNLGQYFVPETQRCNYCPHGRTGAAYSNGTLYCIPCWPGSRGTTARTGCEWCPLGRYQPGWGASRCEPCPPGSYQSSRGQLGCQKCPAGTIAPLASSASCGACPAGTFAGPGATECVPCAIGTFAPEATSANCTPCREGLTTMMYGANNLSHCVCPEDMHWPLGVVLDNSTGPPIKCTPCDRHLYCRAGSNLLDFASGDTSRMFLQEGYMSTVSEPLTFYKCLPTSACPRGGPGTCAANRDPNSVACGRGLPNTYASDGDFERCESRGTDTLFMVVFITAGLMGLAIFSFSISRDLHDQTNAGLLVMAVCGISFSGFQTMGVFNSLSIPFFEPLKAIFRVISVVSLDLKYLRMGCITTLSPVTSYACRQMVAPFAVVVIVFSLLVKKAVKGHVDMLPELLNATGGIFTLFFTSITISAATPFICYPHPDHNKYSMVNEPSILCYGSDASHNTLIALGVWSFVCVACPFLAISAYGTWKHKFLLASIMEKHTRQLRAFRYLYMRFRPERYYFGMVMSLRSLCICLVPVLPGLRDDPALQFCCLSTTLGIFIVVQLLLHPWRTFLANMADGVLMSCNLQLLVGAAISTDFINKGSIGVFGLVIFCAFTILVACGCGYAARLYFFPGRQYHFFICHHKKGAAAQARLLKIHLQQNSNTGVFIDSDDLRELDALFDVVKTQVKHFIVYLTRETLQRPWCAGEVCTAWKSKVLVTTIKTSGFVPPSENELKDLNQYIDFRSVKLTTYGIDLDEIAVAFRELLSPTTRTIDLPAGGTTRFTGVADMIRAFGREGRPSNIKETMTSGSFVISSDPCNDEACASAGIIASKIKPMIMQGVCESTNICVLCDFPEATLDDVARVVAKARSVVVILSSGTLDNLKQLLVMVELVCKGCADLIPVRIDGFEFPDEHFYTEQFPKMWLGDAEAAVPHVRSFFKRIAINLEIAGSEANLDTQIDEIFARVNRGKRKRTSKLLPDPITNMLENASESQAVAFMSDLDLMDSSPRTDGMSPKDFQEELSNGTFNGARSITPGGFSYAEEDCEDEVDEFAHVAGISRTRSWRKGAKFLGEHKMPAIPSVPCVPAARSGEMGEQQKSVPAATLGRGISSGSVRL